MLSSGHPKDSHGNRPKSSRARSFSLESGQKKKNPPGIKGRDLVTKPAPYKTQRGEPTFASALIPPGPDPGKNVGFGGVSSAEIPAEQAGPALHPAAHPRCSQMFPDVPRCSQIFPDVPSRCSPSPRVLPGSAIPVLFIPRNPTATPPAARDPATNPVSLFFWGFLGFFSQEKEGIFHPNGATRASGKPLSRRLSRPFPTFPSAFPGRPGRS